MSSGEVRELLVVAAARMGGRDPSTVSDDTLLVDLNIDSLGGPAGEGT